MVGVLVDGQGDLHKYFRSQRMPQGAHAHFGLPHWPGLGGFDLRARGEGGDLEEEGRRPAWHVQSIRFANPALLPQLPSPPLPPLLTAASGVQVHAHLTT